MLAFSSGEIEHQMIETKLDPSDPDFHTELNRCLKKAEFLAVHGIEIPIPSDLPLVIPARFTVLRNLLEPSPPLDLQQSFANNPFARDLSTIREYLDERLESLAESPPQREVSVDASSDAICVILETDNDKRIKAQVAEDDRQHQILEAKKENERLKDRTVACEYNLKSLLAHRLNPDSPPIKATTVSGRLQELEAALNSPGALQPHSQTQGNSPKPNVLDALRSIKYATDDNGILYTLKETKISISEKLCLSSPESVDAQNLRKLKSEVADLIDGTKFLTSHGIGFPDPKDLPNEPSERVKVLKNIIDSLQPAKPRVRLKDSPIEVELVTLRNSILSKQQQFGVNHDANSLNASVEKIDKNLTLLATCGYIIDYSPPADMKLTDDLNSIAARVKTLWEAVNPSVPIVTKERAWATWSPT
jgi:hypothetical protein